MLPRSLWLPVADAARLSVHRASRSHGARPMPAIPDSDGTRHTGSSCGARSSMKRSNCTRSPTASAPRVIGEWVGFYNSIRPHTALARRTLAEPHRGDAPVDLMDNPLRALPTSSQAPQQQQDDRFKGILAARTSTEIHLNRAVRLSDEPRSPHADMARAHRASHEEDAVVARSVRRQPVFGIQVGHEVLELWCGASTHRIQVVEEGDGASAGRQRRSRLPSSVRVHWGPWAR